MKVVIAGSRNLHNYDLVKSIIIKSGFNITEIVNGMAKGVDYCGVLYSTEMNIPIINFPADWTTYGNAAGPIRNAAMADYADAAIISILNYSKGAMNMLYQMENRNKRYYVAFIRNDEKISTILMDNKTEKDHINGNLPISEIGRSDIKDEIGLFRFFKPTS